MIILNGSNVMGHSIEYFSSNIVVKLAVTLIYDSSGMDYTRSPLGRASSRQTPVNFYTDT